MNLVTLSNLANKRKDARNWEEAERLYRQVLELESVPFAADRLGSLLQTLGRNEEAMALYVRVLKQFPTDEGLYARLWYLHIRMGDLEAAFNDVEELYKQRRDDTSRFISRGDVYYTVFRYDEAIENYKLALHLKPKSEMALERLVWVCLDAGRFDEAIKYANRYVEFWPDQTWSYRLRGWVNSVRGDLDQVFGDVKRLAKLAPDDLTPYALEAVTYLHLGKFARAMEIIEDKYLSSDIADNRRYGAGTNARILVAQGKFNRALAYLDSCLVADSLSDLLYDVASARLQRMYLYEEMGDFDRALAEGRRVAELYLEADPGEMIAWKDYLVQILAMRGDFDEAEEVVRWLKTKAGGRTLASNGFYYGLGAIEFARGDYESAIEYLKISADSTPDRSSSGYFQAPILLARAYLEAGQLEKAIGLYETLLTNTSTNRIDWVVQITKARYHLGRAYELAGRPRDAATQYEKFLNYWGNADVRLESVDYARARLAKLKAGS
ncbi:MAG: tetratricopeptide repeat protein [Candidatus Zixiibacteriota bacterium]